MVPRSVVVCFVLLAAAASATQVQQCEGQSLENLSSRVQLTPCKKIPCSLKKGTDQHISMEFTPESDISDVTNHVSAILYGVPLPFIGVDGNSICDKVYTASGEKTSCPLKAGTTYTYKDSFPVLHFYPAVSLIVKWSLAEKDTDKDIFCFKVPAKITS